MHPRMSIRESLACSCVSAGSSRVPCAVCMPALPAARSRAAHAYKAPPSRWHMCLPLASVSARACWRVCRPVRVCVHVVRVAMRTCTCRCSWINQAAGPVHAVSLRRGPREIDRSTCVFVRTLCLYREIAKYRERSSVRRTDTPYRIFENKFTHIEKLQQEFTHREIKQQ